MEEPLTRPVLPMCPGGGGSVPGRTAWGSSTGGAEGCETSVSAGAAPTSSAAGGSDGGGGRGSVSGRVSAVFADSATNQGLRSATEGLRTFTGCSEVSFPWISACTRDCGVAILTLSAVRDDAFVQQQSIPFEWESGKTEENIGENRASTEELLEPIWLRNSTDGSRRSATGSPSWRSSQRAGRLCENYRSIQADLQR